MDQPDARCEQVQFLLYLPRLLKC
ncbi:protein of unknown function [Cupriavidus taiwanensis]|nr:protein of unknown function [Cupriavidus taiwanensis]